MANKDRQFEFIKKALGSPGKLKLKAAELSEAIAYEFKRRIEVAIKTNKYGYNLSEKTIRNRLMLGVKSATPYLFRGDLLSSLIVKDGSLTVKKGVHYSGLTYEELWFMLEFGRRDKGIPARPIWRPTYQEFLPEIEETWKNFLDKQFNDKNA